MEWDGGWANLQVPTKTKKWKIPMIQGITWRIVGLKLKYGHPRLICTNDGRIFQKYCEGKWKMVKLSNDEKKWWIKKNKKERRRKKNVGTVKWMPCDEACCWFGNADLI